MLNVTPDNLSLPPGVVVERVRPPLALTASAHPRTADVPAITLERA
jgi:hypothetical protein